MEIVKIKHNVNVDGEDYGPDDKEALEKVLGYKKNADAAKALVERGAVVVKRTKKKAKKKSDDK